MKYIDFLEAAENVAEDTAEWDKYWLVCSTAKEFITTDPSNKRKWSESCDNAHGGLDLKWAVLQPINRVKRVAPLKFIAQFIERLEFLEEIAEDYTGTEIIKILLEEFN